MLNNKFIHFEGHLNTNVVQCALQYVQYSPPAPTCQCSDDLMSFNLWASDVQYVLYDSVTVPSDYCTAHN